MVAALPFPSLRHHHQLGETVRQFGRIVDRPVFRVGPVLPRAAAILAPLHPAVDDNQTVATQIYQAILERRPGSIIPWLKEVLAKPDPALGYFNVELRFRLGWAQELAGVAFGNGYDASLADIKGRFWYLQLKKRF